MCELTIDLQDLLKLDCEGSENNVIMGAQVRPSCRRDAENVVHNCVVVQCYAVAFEMNCYNVCAVNNIIIAACDLHGSRHRARHQTLRYGSSLPAFPGLQVHFNFGVLVRDKQI